MTLMTQFAINRAPMTLYRFKSLKRGDAIWSDVYGPGEVLEWYEDRQDQIFVLFENRRVRFRFGDGFFQLPVVKQPRQKRKPILVNGTEYTSMKRYLSLQRTDLKQDHAALAEVAAVLGVSRQRLDRFIAKYNVSIRLLGGKPYLHRDQIKALMLLIDSKEDETQVAQYEPAQMTLF